MQRDLVALPRDEPVAILFQHRRFRLPRYSMDTGEIRGAVHAFLASGAARRSHSFAPKRRRGPSRSMAAWLLPFMAMLSVVTMCAAPSV